MMEKIIFLILHQWKYWIAVLKSKSYKTSSSVLASKAVFVAREKDRTWILGAYVRRLAKYSSLESETYYHDRLKNLPKADCYFFVFPHYFGRAMRHNPEILLKRNIVMFTHPNWTFSYSKAHIIWCLKRAHRVICMNSSVKKELANLGLNETKIDVHIASDPDKFYPHERQNGTVGFCSAFGNRKNPELIFNIVKHMPERHFYLIGKGWEKFEKFDQLTQLENFTYFQEPDYNDYPQLYAKIDIFISPSTLEGGPVPLLEAMLSNCFPIATRTGFAPDIIEHDTNGFLVDTDVDHTEVIRLIKEADNHSVNVRETVLKHSWANCAKKIDSLFQAD